MIQQTSVNWVATLTEVEGAVLDCINALKEYEQVFSSILDHTPQEPVHAAAQHFQKSAETGDAWEHPLEVAGKQADQVEKLLIEQEQLWSNWHVRYSQWRDSLEHPPVGAQGTQSP